MTTSAPGPADVEWLERRASDLGVEVTYDDVDHVVHRADPEVLALVVDVLESDRTDARESVVSHVHLDPTAPVPVHARITDAALLIDGSAHGVLVDVDAANGNRVGLPPDLPVGCHTLQVDTARGAAECLVVVAPAAMPGLAAGARTSSLFAPAYALWDRESPLPSFALLGRLAAHLGQRGVDMLATLPLYATFLDDPFDPSPYSPISRLHWNEVFLADDALPSAPLPDMSDGLLDWRELGARRRAQLLTAAQDLETSPTADSELPGRITQFLAAHPDVGAYARFRADRDAAGDAVVERSHVLAQYLCDEQLAAMRSPGSAGLSLDLPIGSHPDGYERWHSPTLFAPEMAVGAPPDTFFTGGQNWGFPPQLPGAMRSTGFALWRAMIERAGRHADMLRIDHVMAVHRLWWVPDGFPADRGVYVRAPQRELLATIAASAAAAGIAVVGENLGTVPPQVDAALDRWQMLGMYEEQFAMDGPQLAAIPERSVAGVRTHDMAAFADFASSADLHTYRKLLERAIGRRVGSSTGELFEAVLTRLARSDARMIVADLDDLLDETRPHNLPGRVVPGIWQRRLDAPLDETLSDDRVSRRLDLLGRTAR